MLLPNLKNAVIDNEKLLGYSLNSTHLRGRHKARVFKSALGFDESNYLELKRLILEAIITVSCKPGKVTIHGAAYIVDFKHRNIPIRTCWIIDSEHDFPRLTSCYILT